MIRVTVLAAVAACVLAAAPSALAANFTSSQITTPSDGTFFQDVSGASTMLHVVGTTSGGTSNADLVCYFGTSSQVLASNITVTANAFDVNVPTSSFTDSSPKPYCVLRAVPTADATIYPPDAASTFAGPHMGF